MDAAIGAITVGFSIVLFALTSPSLACLAFPVTDCVPLNESVVGAATREAAVEVVVVAAVPVKVVGAAGMVRPCVGTSAAAIFFRNHVSTERSFPASTSSIIAASAAAAAASTAATAVARGVRNVAGPLCFTGGRCSCGEEAAAMGCCCFLLY